MNFNDAMRLRYSTKQYDTSQKLNDTTISQLTEILRLSPSSINSQPWQFTFVSDPEVKAHLAKNSFFNKEKIEEAPLLVVCSVSQDIESFEIRINGELPKPNVDYYNSVIKSQGEEVTRCWFKNQLYIAVGVLLSACAAMELDSTPMEGLNHAMYDSILENSEYTAIVAVAIGYRAKSDKNQPEITPKQRRTLSDVIVVK
ncbi:MAG: NAD(P)H-dependent oxidoreductase [Rikenellaceae bacterium]